MGLIALLDQAARVYADKMRQLWQAAHDRDQARREVAVLTEELAKLQAELEPRDNGDGTVTALLPVTHSKDVHGVAVRLPMANEWFWTDFGPTKSSCDKSGSVIRLILRPAPKPPEQVTWEAPLVDGEWTATDEHFRSSDGARYYWNATGSIIVGLSKPPVLGTYQFKDRVGTLIEESK